MYIVDLLHCYHATCTGSTMFFFNVKPCLTKLESGPNLKSIVAVQVNSMMMRVQQLSNTLPRGSQSKLQCDQPWCLWM